MVRRVEGMMTLRATILIGDCTVCKDSFVGLAAFSVLSKSSLVWRFFSNIEPEIFASSDDDVTTLSPSKQTYRKYKMLYFCRS